MKKSIHKHETKILLLLGYHIKRDMKTINKHQSDSDSSKTCKKKIKKDVFVNNHGSDQALETELKQSDNKRKTKHLTDVNNSDSPKKKLHKIEFESDLNKQSICEELPKSSKKSKNKKNHSDLNESINSHIIDGVTYSKKDKYTELLDLDLSKKKNKKNKSINEKTEKINDYQKDDNKGNSISSLDLSYQNDCEKLHKSPKKSTHGKNNSEINDSLISVIGNNISCIKKEGDTESPNLGKKNKKKNRLSINNDNSSEEINHNKKDENDGLEKIRKKENNQTIKTEFEKSNKRKVKQYLNDSDENNSPKKKRIKIEVESDTDFYKKKDRKGKDVSIDVSQISSIHPDNYDDEYYLDIKVKQEITDKNIKVKKKYSKSSFDLNNQSENEILPKSSEINKQKKSNHHLNESVNRHIVNEDSASETSEANFGQNKNEKYVMYNHNDTDNKSEKLKTQQDYTKNANKIKSEAISRDSISSEDISSNEENTNKKHIERKSLQQSLTFVNGNNFEDENESIHEEHRKKEKTTYSTIFKTISKGNDNLKPVLNKNQKNSIISNDDEIWILKWPQKIDVKTLTKNEITLGSKCKIKINDNTYCGSIENNVNKVTVMSLQQDNYVINNLNLNGIINFRKRIPKLHLQDDVSLTKNQPNFAFLPEANCRHPLFGSDFKRALKQPHFVANQLKENETEILMMQDENRKKHKKLKKHLKEEKDEENITIETEYDAHKKSRKRKYSDNKSKHSTKKMKVLSSNPESAEAWKSEKAIEETLFNF
ncbi:myb-like protein X isoform X2 [Galleria mellonella]|uniref:Myb-like protein X isoform X2 n=1 Tax=Galleria mellonella TaxID=7137 RepID=A0A6J3C3X2_GALME|nr:myb-like protein X isoform X2 [Galleria mellonella]